MAKKMNARQRREADASRRKDLWSPTGPAPAAAPARAPAKPAPPVEPAEATARTIPKREQEPQQTPEEEARLFLEYLDRYDRITRKDDTPRTPGKKAGGAFIRDLDLEKGMPTVAEALDRLRMGLQEMRSCGAKAVRLIHGYGSTGVGGKIRPAVRQELASLERKKFIKDFIPGEDFGPMDAASRQLADRNRSITRDPDYGRINHGITIVVL